MALLFGCYWATTPRADLLRLSQELTLNTEVVQDKSKAKRRKLERALQGAIKEKNILPKDAFRVEHLNYKVSPLLSRKDAFAELHWVPEGV